MKRIILAIVAVVLAVPAFGQGQLTEREKDQKARVKAGVKDGSITKAEAAKLKQEQRQIKGDVKAAHADGAVTGKEAAKITREQNKASHDIYKQKHDKQNQK